VWCRDIDLSLDAFFMLASDGVWEFIESDEVISLASLASLISCVSLFYFASFCGILRHFAAHDDEPE
jgi:hypothetical protein